MGPWGHGDEQWGGPSGPPSSVAQAFRPAEGHMKLMRTFAIALMLGLGLASSGCAQAPPSTAACAKVYELRTYYAAPGKLEALHARFRNHTIDIFKKHGMGVVAFWVPVDQTTGAATGNTLVYILSYPTLDARKQAWV